MIKEREEIVKMLPDKFDCIETYTKPTEVSAFYNGKMWGYNSAISDTADKLTERVAGVEEIATELCQNSCRHMSVFIDGAGCSGCQSAYDIAEALSKEFIILKRKEVEK